MIHNVGPLERKIRAALGLLLLVLAFFIEWPDATEAVLAVFGIFLLATAWARYCPLNHLFGIRSRGR